MGGTATFSGTTYQARVTALVCCHLLAESPLGWLVTADTPASIEPEVGGLGDDLRIYLDGGTPIEAQVKHGFRRGPELRELLAKLAGDANGHLALVVDSSTSATIRIELRHDLERLRSGQEHALHAITTELQAETLGGFDTLRRLHVIVLDVDFPHEGGARSAIAFLSGVLVNPTQAEAAWAIVLARASDACARRLRLTRDGLVDELRRGLIYVKPRRPNDRWHTRLDFTKGLVENHHNDAALAELRRLREDIGATNAEPKVWYRLKVQESSTYRHLGRSAEALQLAKEALELEPQGIEALRNAFYAALITGDLDLARLLSTRAVIAAPDDVSAWVTTLHLARYTGEAPPTPTAPIESAPEYTITRAEIAFGNDDYEQANQLSEVALQAGLRTPWALLIRAQAKLSSAAGSPTATRSDFEDVERWSTEVMGLLATERHPLASTALAIRAEARRRLGLEAEAAADTERLQSLDPDDPNGLRQTAGILAADGKLEQALVVLQRASVEGECELLAIRARVHADLGHKDEARRDSQASERLLGNANDPILARAHLGEVALLLDEGNTAERHLSELEGRAPNRAPVKLLRARLLAHKERYDEAAEAYHVAAASEPLLGHEILGELGQAANRWRRPDLAVQAFDKIGEEKIPEHVLPSFAHALLESGDLVRAGALVDRVGQQDSVPTWVIGLAAELATRQGDTEAQIHALERLIGRRDADATLLLHLIRGLLEVGRIDEAKSKLDVALGFPALTAIERMQAASFLHQLGEEERAISEAFTAYRDDPNDPAINRGFISTVILSRGSPRTVTEVGPGTFVRLESDSGRSRVHRVLAAPPYIRQHDECSVEEAKALGLLGKRVGEELAAASSGIDKWRIAEIAPIEVQEANEAAAAYESRFPLEPFFLRGFDIGDGDQVRDLAPIIASVQGRRAFVEKAIAAQAQQGLPLAMLAKMIGVPIADVMVRSDAAPIDWPLHVEWGAPGEQEAVLSVLGQNRELILTRSALHTASTIGLLDVLVQAYRLVAPRTLRLDLDEECRDAERALSTGMSTIGTGVSGISIEEVPAGHQLLVNRLTEARRQRDFLLQNVSLLPRPLEVVAQDGADALRAIEGLGASAYDAVRLTEHTGAVLYSDDLGLRRFGTTGTRNPSCSTITLLRSLTERGVISPEQRDRWLIDLVARRYSTVLPTPELIGFAVSHAVELGSTVVRQTIGTLRAGSGSLSDAVATLIEVIRNQAVAPVVVISTQEVVRLSLDALASLWQPRLVVGEVVRQANLRLRFLPAAHRDCLSACHEFAERQGVRRPG